MVALHGGKRHPEMSRLKWFYVGVPYVGRLASRYIDVTHGTFFCLISRGGVVNHAYATKREFYERRAPGIKAQVA